LHFTIIGNIVIFVVVIDVLIKGIFGCQFFNHLLGWRPNFHSISLEDFKGGLTDNFFIFGLVDDSLQFFSSLLVAVKLAFPVMDCIAQHSKHFVIAHVVQSTSHFLRASSEGRNAPNILELELFTFGLAFTLPWFLLFENLSK
jgi:hypothetical protein